MERFKIALFIMFVALKIKASSVRNSGGWVLPWNQQDSGNIGIDPENRGYQGHRKSEYHRDISYPAFDRRRGYDSSTISTIHLYPGASRIIKPGTAFMHNEGINTEIWDIQAPDLVISADCYICFSNELCQSPSIIIGTKKFFKGNTNVGVITRKNQLEIIFTSQGSNCGFICTIDTNRGELDNFNETFPTCSGNRQSPINIVTLKTIGTYPWREIGFHNYNKNSRVFRLTNNGRSAILSTDRSDIYLMGGALPLNNKYILHEVVFHWGPNDTSGSEHVVNGQRFAGEIQLIHYNAKYNNYIQALNEDEGLVTIAVFLEISQVENRHLRPIISGLDKILEAGSSTAVGAFPLGRLLPADKDDFFRYRGSITSPSCQESVFWTIFVDPIGISSTQLSKFRKLQDGNGDEITNNLRPVQDLNARTVSRGQLTPSWSYDGPDGQKSWASRISSTCGGNKQSPINIMHYNIVKKTFWTPPLFRNFDRLPNNITLINNDNGVILSPIMDYKATIIRGPLYQPYRLFQYHFHWGSPNTKGSEHTINRKRYAGEIHMMIYQDSRGGVGPSLGVERGVIEMGVFLELSRDDNPKLNSIIRGLTNIILSGSKTDIEPFPLDYLLPDNLKDYFYYDGSLSAPVPLCDQTARVLLFKKPIPISRHQLNKFYNLENAAGYKIRNNYRKIQPLNGRLVFSSAPAS